MPSLMSPVLFDPAVSANGFHESSSSSSSSSSSIASSLSSRSSSSSSSEDSADEQENVCLFSSSSTSSAAADLSELDGAGADMVAAVKVLLNCLGEDVNRNGLLKTPVRVARAFAFATKGYRQVAKDIVGDALFPEAGVEAGYGFAGGFGGTVVVRNIDLFSLCEACLLPFKVCCHIAYISSGLKVVGLSKLSRVADMFARRLQNPQRLACEISQGLEDAIKPLGVGIVLQSWHLPVPGAQGLNFSSFHGAKKVFQHSALAFAGKGQFDDRTSAAWNEFLSILQLEGILMDNCDITHHTASSDRTWCPCAAFDKGAFGLDTSPCDLTCCRPNRNCDGGNDGRHILSTEGDKSTVMAAAVDAILQALGEGTMREELSLTPKRFTRWLMNFDRSYQVSDMSHVCQSGSFEKVDVHSLRPPSPTYFSPSMQTGALDSGNIFYELDAPFCSLCEHHLLPFYGRAHVGYLSPEALDRTAILKIVEVTSQRLQVQERLTKDIAEALTSSYNVQNIIVVLEASHICMVSRGVEKLGSSTATLAVFGSFATDATAKASFLKVITGRSIKRTSDKSLDI